MTDPREKTLVETIDDTAMKLLKKVSGDDKLEGDGAITLFLEQIKAFEAIVKWAVARTPLLPKTETPKETRFAGLKRNFNAGAGGKAKRGARGSAAKAAGGSADEAAGSDPDSDADADPDSDPGSES